MQNSAIARFEARQNYIDNIESIIKNYQSQKLEITKQQPSIDVAVEDFILNNNLSSLNRLTLANGTLSAIAGRNLDKNTIFKEFRRVENSPKIAIIGITAKNEEVIGDLFDPLSLASIDKQTEILQRL